MKTKNKPKGITRIEIPARNTFGWMVRIRRGQQRPHEFFSDKKYGGNRGAEKAAAARYKEIEKEMPEKQPSKNRMTKRNKSGKVGVHINIDTYKNGPIENDYYAYVAKWTDNHGERKTKSFAWNKYGDEDAYDLACIARDYETQDMNYIKSIYKKTKNKELQI